MKRFSEQFKKKSDSIRLRATERADLRDRLMSYMEYHPLPAEMRTTKVSSKKKLVEGIPSEAFRAIHINMHYLQGFVGVFAVFLVVGVPLIAEKSVPGDMLYPVKTNITEEVRASLTLSPYAKVEWETQRLERRVAEARLLAKEGKLTAETEAQVAQAVRVHTDAAQQEIATMRESDADEAAIAGIAFASALEVQSEVLEGYIAQTDEVSAGEEGSSVDVLASVVSEAAGVAGVAQGQNTPSYEKLLGRVEVESTYAYELFESVNENASEAEILDIERRLADIERKITRATEAYSADIALSTEMTEEVPVVDTPEVVVETEELDEPSTETGTTTPVISEAPVTDTPIVTEVEEIMIEEGVTENVELVPTEVATPKPVAVDSVTLLREALKDLQKLVAFMTDIDVRETVTIEKLVPVVLTNQERLAIAQNQYDEARGLSGEIAQRVVTEEYTEKVEAGMAQLMGHMEAAAAALAEQEVVAAETASAEAVAIAQDIYAMVSDMSLKETEQSPAVNASSSEPIASEEETEIETTEDTEQVAQPGASL